MEYMKSLKGRQSKRPYYLFWNYSRPEVLLTRKSLFENQDIDSKNIKKDEYLNDGDIILSYSDEEQSEQQQKLLVQSKILVNILLSNLIIYLKLFLQQIT